MNDQPSPITPLLPGDGELLHAIVDADRDMMWVVDAETLTLTWWNRTAVEYMGDHGVTLEHGSRYTEGEVARMRREQLVEFYRRALAEGRFQVEVEWAPGLWMDFEFTAMMRDGKAYAVLAVGRDVTGRKRIEAEREEALRRLKEEQQALEEREQQQRLLLRNAPAAILEVDPATMKILSANEYACQTSGYPLEELRESAIFDFMDEPARARMRASAFVAAGTAPVTAEECTLISKNGERHTLLFNSAFITADGRPPRLLVVGHDISEQKRATERLVRAEAKYHAVVDNIHEGLVILSDQRIVYLNEMACRVAQRTAEECMAAPVSEFIHPDDRPGVAARLRELVATGIPFMGYEFRVVRRLGEPIWTVARGSLVDWEGEPAVAVLLEDISERRAAQMRLEESEARFRQMADLSTVGVFILDEDRTIEYVNETFAAAFGREREEMIGRTPADFLHPEDVPQAGRAIGQRMTDDKVDTGTLVRAVKKDGTIATVEFTSRRTQVEGRAVLLGTVKDVTAQVQAEAALKQSAEIINTMFRSAPDAFYMVTRAEGRFVELNHALEEMFGYSRAEMIGRTSAELGLWEEPADRAGLLLRLDPDGRAGQYEGTWRRKNGETFPCAVSMATCEVDGVECIVGFIRDETERQEAQAALVESEARYRLLADNIVDLIWLADPETLRFTYITPSVRSLDGSEPEDLVGLEMLARVAPAQREERRRMFRDLRERFLAGDEPFLDTKADVELLRKDGTTRWAEVYVRIFRDPGTGKETLLGITRDKSVQKAAEDALEEKQAQLDRFFDLGVGLLSIGDMEGHFVLVSAGWEKALGYSRDEIMAMRNTDLIHPDDLAHSAEAMARLAEGLDAGDVINRVRTKAGGYRTLTWRCVPAGGLVYSAARDITDLPETEEQLRQSQKMEAIGQLAGGIAHDFNNLLTAILGYSDLLLASAEGRSESLRFDLLEIKGAAKRAADLTQQILAFSRKQALRLELIRIDDVLVELKPFLERLAGEHVVLEVQTAGDLGACELDRSQFSQVLINMIANARDAMPNGGFVILEAGNIEIGRQRSHPALAELEPGPYVLVKCIDTGVGMDPDTVSRIFEPFFTTKPAGQGTGLGLATVYGIIRQSGGTLVVESEVGKGTTFSIYLPRLEGVYVGDATGEEPFRAEVGHGTVLIVEDEEAVRVLAERILTTHGYTVISVSRSAEAMNAILDPGQAVDLLLTDILLPQGLQGGELAEAARSVRAGLPILYMSGYSRDSNIHGGRLDEKVNFLQKPFTPTVLIQHVEEALTGRSRPAGTGPKGL